MTTLSDALLDPARRPAAVTALVAVVDAEVAAKSGFGGAAVKTAYAGVKRIGGGFVDRAVDRLLPRFATALEPFWQSREGRPFGAHLASQSDAASDALLAVTDDMAARTSNATAKKAYGALRGKAKGNVEAALPRLGTAIENLAG